MHRAQAATRADRDAKALERSLADLREKIDALDDELLDLVERRLAASRAVAALKSSRRDGHLWLRPRREQEVIDRLTKRAPTAPRRLVEQLWRELMGFSLQEQVKTVLVFQGRDVERLKACARVRFGSAAPLRFAASAAEALQAALKEEAVALIALDGEAEWVERLHPALSIFDWVRDETGEVVAAAVGRIPPEELPDHPASPERLPEAGR